MQNAMISRWNNGRYTVMAILGAAEAFGSQASFARSKGNWRSGAQLPHRAVVSEQAYNALTDRFKYRSVAQDGPSPLNHRLSGG